MAPWQCQASASESEHDKGNDHVYPPPVIDALVVKVPDGQVVNRRVYVVISATINGEATGSCRPRTGWESSPYNVAARRTRSRPRTRRGGHPTGCVRRPRFMELSPTHGGSLARPSGVRDGVRTDVNF